MTRLLMTTTALVGLLTAGAMAQAPANTMAPGNGMTPANTMTPGGNMAPAGNSMMAPANNSMMAPANTTTTTPNVTTTTVPANNVTVVPANNMTTTMPANNMTTTVPADTMPAGSAGTTAQATPPTGMVQDQTYSVVAGDNLASRVIGSTVYTSAGDDAETIGDVNDLVVDSNGQVAAAVIGVGGFLGIGEKDVAIDFDQMQWTQAADGTWRWTLATTADALNAAPEFQYQDQNDVDAAGANNANNNAVVDAPATNTMMAPAAGAVGAVGAAGTGAAAATTGAIDRSTMTPVDMSTMTADNLDGTPVYGVNDERIGEIGDVVLNEQGSVDAVIVDVGGFLGIGEKQVAVGFDALNFSQDQNGNRYLFINSTQDQLEAQPEFDRDTYAAQRSTQRMVVTP